MSGTANTKNFYETIKNRVYNRIVAEVKGAQQIMDIGCGSCELAEFIAQRTHCKVIGVDISDAGFPLFRQRGRQGLARLVNCLKGDAENLHSFRTNSIDAVVSTYALHEFQHPLLVLKEIYRILKPGACFVMVDFARHSLAEQLWGDHYFTKAEVKELLNKAGFKDPQVKLIADNQLLLARAGKTSAGSVY